MSSSELDLLETSNTFEENLRKSAHEIKTCGYTVLDGEDFIPDLKTNFDKKNFLTYWDDLERDRFMQDNGIYRKRRFGRFRFNRQTTALTPVGGNLEFHQSESINQLNGGKKRFFAPVSHAFYTDECLALIVKRCLDVILLVRPQYQTLTINTHLIRIVCGHDSIGFPTPEGIHRDGHCFVSQHLVKRENIYGGVSGIYSLDNKPALHLQLYDFMDTVIIDDNKV